MRDDTRGLLHATDPDDAGDDRVLGEGGAEGVFVANAVLHDGEDGGVGGDGFEEGWGGGGVDGFVGADYVVEFEGCCLGGGFEDWLGSLVEVWRLEGIAYRDQC